MSRKPSNLQRHVWALVVFAVGCVLSAGIASYARQEGDQIDDLRFASETRLASRFISERLERYVNALIHTKALFAVEKRITREQFRRYIDDLDLFQKYPGTLGIGYATQVNGKYIVVSVEPHGPFSERVVGSDLGATAMRREAIDRAARSGHPTISQRVKVFPGGSNLAGEAGFLILNPIYSKGKSTETTEQRERAVEGMVFSPFEASSFFNEIFKQNPIDPAIGLTVYDGKNPQPGTLLFQRYSGMNWQKTSARFERIRQIEVAGRIWSVDFRAMPSFQSGWARRVPGVIFAIGVLISYLLAQLIWSMQSRFDREHELVEKVRQAIASRDEFISIASHELKTPITSLKLQLAMALRHPDKSVQFIREGDGQATRLNRLIDELLDMTRIQAGRMKYDFESTDLSQLVREITARYQEQLSEAGCELRVTAPEPVVAEVDRFRFEQVLVNLLSNAMKYARGKPVDIWVERLVPTAVIRMTDHGPGIPPEKKDLVFTRFERLNEDKSISGLGLGLYITRQIVEAHGGRIWVQSEPGHGSTFTVELPIRQNLRQSAPSST